LSISSITQTLLVTNEQGAFSIPDLSPGNYVLKAWHEDGGIKSQEIAIPESSGVRVSFEFGKNKIR